MMRSAIEQQESFPAAIAYADTFWFASSSQQHYCRSHGWCVILSKYVPNLFRRLFEPQTDKQEKAILSSSLWCVSLYRWQTITRLQVRERDRQREKASERKRGPIMTTEVNPLNAALSQIQILYFVRSRDLPFALRSHFKFYLLSWSSSSASHLRRLSSLVRNLNSTEQVLCVLWSVLSVVIVPRLTLDEISTKQLCNIYSIQLLSSSSLRNPTLLLFFVLVVRSTQTVH